MATWSIPLLGQVEGRLLVGPGEVLMVLTSSSRLVILVLAFGLSELSWPSSIFFLAWWGRVGEGGKIYNLLKVSKFLGLLPNLISFLGFLLVVICWSQSITSI